MTPAEILISAGDPSGEMYAARLVQALEREAGARVFGLGGPAMQAAGVELLAEASELAVVGISEAVGRLPAAWRALRRLGAAAEARRPRLAVLVDFPDFNLRLARSLHRAGIPIVYFISPQVWAWRSGRVKLLREVVARMIVIFPFEEKFYRERGIPAEYVGHPLVEMAWPGSTREEFLARHGLEPRREVVALLPGSRPSEIAHNLPVILAACRELRVSPEPQFVLAAAPGLTAREFAPHLEAGPAVWVVEGETRDALAAARCAIVSSGTATVEAALLGTPMVVVYRLSPTTAFLARRLVRSPFFSMVNLILERRAVPELIQEAFTAEKLAGEVRRLLVSQEACAEMKRGLEEVRARLASPSPRGAIGRAAEIILGML
jgi:lipid-A-disaccharide synthase